MAATEETSVEVEIQTEDETRIPVHKPVQVELANDGSVSDNEIRDFNERNQTVPGVKIEGATVRRRGITLDTKDPYRPATYPSTKDFMASVDRMTPYIPIVRYEAHLAELPNPIRDMAMTANEWYGQLEELLDGTNMEAVPRDDFMAIVGPPERCCQASNSLNVSDHDAFTEIEETSYYLDCYDCGATRTNSAFGVCRTSTQAQIRDLSEDNAEPETYWIHPTPEHMVTAAIERRSHLHNLATSHAEKECATMLQRLTDLQPPANLDPETPVLPIDVVVAAIYHGENTGHNSTDHVRNPIIGATLNGEWSNARRPAEKELHRALIEVHPDDHGHTVVVGYVEDSTADPHRPPRPTCHLDLTLKNGDKQNATGVVEYDAQWNVLEVWSKDQSTGELIPSTPDSPDRGSGLSIAD